MSETEVIELAVVGAHLRGQPLEHQLTDRSARFLGPARTEPCYRLYALETVPPKPGLVRTDPADAAAGTIEVELWSLSAEAFGSFVAAIPAPLTIGRVRLHDGQDVAGFLCEPVATTAAAGAVDITSFGGWRAYLAQRAET